jgi:hypothetical protein
LVSFEKTAASYVGPSLLPPRSSAGEQ